MLVVFLVVYANAVVVLSMLVFVCLFVLLTVLEIANTLFELIEFCVGGSKDTTVQYFPLSVK